MDTTKTILRVLGPTKIKDGLFMGDQIAAHDQEWIMMNQVTHIVNCCGRDVPNLYEQQGINYLTFPWTENQTQNLFDSKDANLNEIVRFIQEAAAEGGAVLVHSRQSDSRSCCVLSAYLMKRFKWNLFKTLEFLNSRKEDVELQPQFFQQLSNLQNKLMRAGALRSGAWDVVDPNDPEEEIIRNTYLNSRQGPTDDPYFTKHGSNKIKKNKLQWKDKEDRPGKIAMEVKYSSEEKISSDPISDNRKMRLKSILKGSNKVFEIKDKSQDRISERPQERPQQRNDKTERPVDESRNKSSKSVLQKGAKRQLAVESVDPKPSTKILDSIAAGSGKAVASKDNKENIREFYEKNEILKQRQRISSFQRFKKAYIEAENMPKKKDSAPIKEQPTPLNNNWVIKTDFKNLKNVKLQQDRKDSKPIIIVKPNLNMTIVQPEVPKRAVSEKKKQAKDVSKQNIKENLRQSMKEPQPKKDQSNCPDVYLKALKQRMLIESAARNVAQTKNTIDTPMQPKMAVKKQRSSSAKQIQRQLRPKMQDSKIRERQLFTINNLLDMQAVSKPKWKF